MKIKTSELTGSALDWAVATCEGHLFDIGEGWNPNYAANWLLGGPIIEKEMIRIEPDICSREWEACPGYGMSDQWVCYGPTPLIAAMRCYVASKLGDEVDIPETLCKT